MKKLVMILAVVVMILSVNFTSYAFEVEDIGTQLGYEEVLNYIRSDNNSVIEERENYAGNYAVITCDEWNVEYTVLGNGTMLYEHPTKKGTNMEYTFHRMWRLPDETVWMYAYDFDGHLINVTKVY